VQYGNDRHRLVRRVDREDVVVLAVDLPDVLSVGDRVACGWGAVRERLEALDEPRLVATLLCFTPGLERGASDLPQVGF